MAAGLVRASAVAVTYIDVASVLGPERPLEAREGDAFFRLRNEVLHMIRNETGGQR